MSLKPHHLRSLITTLWVLFVGLAGNAQELNELVWNEVDVADLIQVAPSDQSENIQSRLDDLLTSTAPRSIVTGDFNHSGYDDILVLQNNPLENENVFGIVNAGPLGLFLNRAADSPVDHDLGWLFFNMSPGKFSDGEAVDLNGDGWLDLVFAGDNGFDSRFYINRTNIQPSSSMWYGFDQYTLEEILPAHRYMSDIAIADVNDDGFPDIYLHSGHLPNLEFGEDYLFLNDGDGDFINASETWLGLHARTPGGSEATGFATNSRFPDVCLKMR